MMTRYLCLCLFVSIFCSFNTAYTQKTIQRDTGMNLVPNPSFEKLRRPMPDVSVEPYLAFRNFIENWTSPTETTPDLLFNINSESANIARTGDQMIGILTHNPNSKRSGVWREYLQIKLDRKMKFGETYLLEFWVKRHLQATMSSNNIGALLSRVPIINKDIRPITDLQLVVNESNIINPNQSEWHKISTSFTANGDEQFLIIGNFFDNEHTTFKKVEQFNEPAWHNPYYLLDDVSLRQISIIEPSLEDVAIEKGAVIRLDRIYFEFDKWNLLPESFVQLDQLVKLLNKYPNMQIAINGHTDSKGSLNYNKLLSDNRAQAVYSYLISQFIDNTRLEFKGYGEAYPIASNKTDEGRQNNRRVEFVVLELGEENVEIIND